VRDWDVAGWMWGIMLLCLTSTAVIPLIRFFSSRPFSRSYPGGALGALRDHYLRSGAELAVLLMLPLFLAGPRKSENIIWLPVLAVVIMAFRTIYPKTGLHIQAKRRLALHSEP
jgi:hypothetical protein